MTPKEFIQKQDNGYIAGDYTPNEVYLLMIEYSKLKSKESMTNLDIVKKLIGNIRPIGKSEVDVERFENLKAMCQLANELIIEIDSVGYDFKDDKQGSVRQLSDYAQNFLTVTIGIGS